MSDIIENLNDKQKEAVFKTEGYVRVIAGAGSGKTKLLVSRYAYLVKDYGIDSANILCVTFTNKAAAEMKKRIRKLIGDEHDTTLICTYHSFCNRLLRENPEKLFLNKEFQIIDTYQQKSILGEIYQKYELKLDYATFENFIKKITLFKRNSEYVPKICNPKPCQIINKINNQDDQIIEDYLQKQKATYSLDFQDLISFAIYVLENHDEIREKWQYRLNYIMVDEFQDSSSIEMKLIDILSAKYQNLMIVGDPDQNIYEWRGSDIKLLVDFDKTHAPTETIILNQNYRSTPEILNCANTLIEKNEFRIKKNLFTNNSEKISVIHYHSKNDNEELTHIIENINNLIRGEGFDYSNFAILYRSSFLSRLVEKKFVEKNIPYEIFGGVKFFQRMEILDMLAYLKLITFDDDIAFKRIINKPKRRFGRTKMNLLEKIKDKLIPNRHNVNLFSIVKTDETKKKNNSLFETLVENITENEFQNSDVFDFLQYIKEIRKAKTNMRISEIINDVSIKTGYEQYIRELGDEERLDNLSEFKRIANEFEKEFGEDLSLEEFLQEIALQSGEDSDDNRNTVKLMTIHSAKGLEFPVVFVLGLTEGIFPSSKTIEERKKLGLEEERRLCYVAITRAQKYLFLMDSEGTSPKGIKKKLSSRFLYEIGDNNYIRIGKIPDELLHESKSYISKSNFQINIKAEITEKNIGDIVEHHIFGTGTIISVDSKRRSYVIQFDKLLHTRSISMDYFNKKNTFLESSLQSSERNVAIQNYKIIPNNNQIQTIPQIEYNKNISESQNPISLIESVSDKDIIDAKIEKTSVIELPKEAYSSISKEQNIKNSINKIEKSSDIETSFRASEREMLGQKNITVNSSNNSDINNVINPIINNKENYNIKSIPQKESVCSPSISGLKNNSSNLLKNGNVPRSGWTCVGVEDLGAPVGICQLCGYQIIRYAHHMIHPLYSPLVCGCVCAGKLEGSIINARKREADFKNMQSRRNNFINRNWKKSRRGNEYLKINGHVVVLYFISFKNQWKYSIDNNFCQTSYVSREQVLEAVFIVLEKLR